MQQTCGATVQLSVLGQTYPVLCAKPAGLFPGGAWCTEHAPAQPHPDPARSATGLESRGRATFAPKTYGHVGNPPEIDIRKTRLLKAHTDAVKTTMLDAAMLITAVGMDGFAEVMAGAVMSADDASTRYCVAVRDGTSLRIYGSYPTQAGADKAVASGLVPVLSTGARAAVLPLQPAPRASKKPAARKAATPSKEK